MKRTQVSAFIMLFIVAMAGFSCGNRSGKDKETVLPAELVTNPGTGNNDSEAPVARITFTSEEHDFGTIKDGAKVFWNFRFTNTGNIPLIINRVKADCGCTVPEYPKTPIEPGEGGKIRVTFDSRGRPGRQIKKVTVLSNSERPTNVLTISALVEN